MPFLLTALDGAGAGLASEQSLAEVQVLFADVFGVECSGAGARDLGLNLLRGAGLGGLGAAKIDDVRDGSDDRANRQEGHDGLGVGAEGLLHNDGAVVGNGGEGLVVVIAEEEADHQVVLHGLKSLVGSEGVAEGSGLTTSNSAVVTDAAEVLEVVQMVTKTSDVCGNEEDIVCGVLHVVGEANSGVHLLAGRESGNAQQILTIKDSAAEHARDSVGITFLLDGVLTIFPKGDLLGGLLLSASKRRD